MKVVIQRVSEASVAINKVIKSKIDTGLLILLGVEDADNEEDINWLCNKIVQLRIFGDADGALNLSVKEVDGNVIVVSQFTLHASTKKGNRPSFIKAAKPAIAIPLYNQFIQQLSLLLDKEVQSGEFGADMKIAMVNDGPVTIIIDSKNKV